MQVENYILSFLNFSLSKDTKKLRSIFIFMYHLLVFKLFFLLHCHIQASFVTAYFCLIHKYLFAKMLIFDIILAFFPFKKCFFGSLLKFLYIFWSFKVDLEPFSGDWKRWPVTEAKSLTCNNAQWSFIFPAISFGDIEIWKPLFFNTHILRLPILKFRFTVICSVRSLMFKLQRYHTLTKSVD